MKLLLLFDQNLSYKLVDRLADLYPGSTHVRQEGLSEVDDHEVWEFARDNGYTIVSQEGDFFDMSVLNGAPPKIIWLTCGKIVQLLL